MELTGLEEPEELWDRLREATDETHALAEANRKLAERVRVLERQVSDAGSLSDDDLVAELPKRMTHALESAQAVAGELVRRAKKRAALIEQQADAAASGILRQAEGEASSILARAGREAAAHLANAKAKAQEVVGLAEERRMVVLAELESETVALERGIRLMKQERSRLVQAYEVVERTLGEAREALSDTAEAPHRNGTPPPARREAPVGPPVRQNGARAASPSRLYDWSPAGSLTR
jgi:cell division septum initiation protein DivIVA